MSAAPIHARARENVGFTLVELLAALLIMAILSAISVTAYTRLRDRSEISGAELNVREALSAAELYYAHNETYTGMTISQLHALDGGVKLSAEPVVAADGKSFCIQSTHNGNAPTASGAPGHNAHSLTGPGGDIVAGICPTSL